jgi:Uma2 family endonuclease
MHFEREPELVHGELVERSLPTFPHGNIQLRLGARLLALQSSHALFTGVEVRVRLGPDLRIPDIAMWQGSQPESIPTVPPLVVAEVLSPDDRIYDVLLKLAEYEAWGVQHIWLIEPELKQCHVYRNGSFNPVSQLELPELGFSLDSAELFG